MRSSGSTAHIVLLLFLEARISFLELFQTCGCGCGGVVLVMAPAVESH
jgi:hypothetical protein